MRTEGIYIFGIGEGPSTEEKQMFGNLSAASGFATSMGEMDLSSVSNFLRSILSGDSSTQMQVLSPQIDAAKQRAEQSKKMIAEFGNRSGGNAASVNQINFGTSSDITNLTGNLMGSAASSLGSLGSGLLSQGMGGYESGFGMAKTLHDQNLAKWNDIFKSSASVAEAGFGMIPGGSGSVGDVGSNFFGGIS